jgi:glycosyltransferase involved in cell wall biosynthesis
VRLLALTAGAGGMYCGSCLRDNALAAQLMALGHDVTLLPLYTPTLTDEANVSDGHVFFGGISVYLEQHVPLFRRTPKILDTLWDAGAVIKAFANRSVSVDPRLLGELTVSMLRGEEGHQRKELRNLVDWLAREPRFDVISLPFTLLIGLAPALRRLGSPIACTLQGEDLFLEGLDEPWRTQAKDLIRRQVPSIDAFIAVSDYYARFMSGYLDIPRERIHKVPIGINLEGHSERARRGHEPFTLGYFARVAPEKGLHRLAEAYRILRRERGVPSSRLLAAGYLAPEHKGYLAQVEARLAEWGLRDEFEYRGVLSREEKMRFLRELDVLSVPGEYVEPKGLYMLEAMANGVPVVQPRHGAFPEILERTGGGLLFDPADLGDLADAVLSLHVDPERAAELGRCGAEGVRRHYSARRMAERTAEVFASLVSEADRPRA